MSYEKQTFVDKQTKLTAEHLNHIEDGIVDNEKAIAKNAEDVAANASALKSKQDSLVSGSNIKTINGQSILGKGNLEFSTPGSSGALYFDIVSEFVGGTSGKGDEDDTTPDNPVDTPAAVALSTDSWDVIAAAIQSGDHPYKIGDTKTITAGGTDYTLRLCDLTAGRYQYADNSRKTNAVFEFVEPYGSSKQYINSTERTNVGGYAATLTPAFMKDTVLPSLPAELQQVIPDILLPYNIGGTDTTIQTLSCKLYLASAYELTGDNTNNTGTAEGSPQYQLPASDSSKNIKLFKGNATYWWTRSPNNSGAMDYIAINPSGALQSLGSLGNQCVVPYFAI